MKNNSGESNLVTKQYLNKALKDVVRKKDLKISLRSMENRIVKKINQVVDFFDDEVQPLKNKASKIEEHLHLPQQV